MKRLILAASLLALLSITTPVLAVEAHHPENQSTQVEAQTDTSKMDVSVQQMQEMRKKIESEKNTPARKELMHQHMGMMKDGMNMMTMMEGQAGMMEQKEASSMPMADRMAMMEKKMEMMSKMMGQGGSMMGGMMGGSPPNDRLGMMEKKMIMMQEMLNGMMMQQEMMMK